MASLWRRGARLWRSCRQFSKPPVSHFTLCLWSRSVPVMYLISLSYLMSRYSSAGNVMQLGGGSGPIRCAPLIFSVINCSTALSQVLALPSEVIAAVPPSSERPASAYKAAVDKFTKNESSDSRMAERQEKEPSLPDVPESKTELLQQLITSAKTLTAREDLLNTLRLDRSLLRCCLSDYCSHLSSFSLFL